MDKAFFARKVTMILRVIRTQRRSKIGREKRISLSIWLLLLLLLWLTHSLEFLDCDYEKRDTPRFVATWRERNLKLRSPIEFLSAWVLNISFSFLAFEFRIFQFWKFILFLFLSLSLQYLKILEMKNIQNFTDKILSLNLDNWILTFYRENKKKIFYSN